MDKKEKIKFIKNFAKLNLKSICLKVGVPTQNIYSETASESAVDKVFYAILLELNKIKDEANGKR